MSHTQVPALFDVSCGRECVMGHAFLEERKEGDKGGKIS